MAPPMAIIESWAAERHRCSPFSRSVIVSKREDREIGMMQL
jgi:hypothetical protein